ncbi:unnamed protein product [Prorocentrum cordatum]|uniref:Photosystem I assembly protein Ycf4 n=1 Tax=Prorocentrum cordatum TaxID=2364126 RepID=A0ABN9UVH2_9DINO|nr:unnamed protein product [Polarella glacialis]
MAGPRRRTREPGAGRLQARRGAALALLGASACAAGCGAGFVSAPGRGARARPTKVQMAADQVVRKIRRNDRNIALYPKDQMFKIAEDGSTLREEYGGGRSILSTFWAIVQPAASFGFLIVGLSVYFGDNIVEWTPLTASALGFLRKSDDMLWVPQGIFMTFYGFFGLFLFGPIQWYILFNNPGRGVAEFSKRTKRFTKIVDGQVLEDIPFDDIKSVKFEWSDLFILGKREVYLVLKDGKSVSFQDLEAEAAFFWRLRFLFGRTQFLSDLLCSC